MCQIVLDVPNEVMYDIHMNTAEATSFAGKMLALGLYTKANVSIGYCATVAGMTEEEFINFLGTYNISVFRYDHADELMKDIANA